MNRYDQEETEPKKKRKFRLFDTQREGKGVSKEQALNEGTGLKRFFRLYRDNLGKLFSLNIMMVLGCIPLLFAILALSGTVSQEFSAPMSSLFPLIRAESAGQAEATPANLVVLAIDGLQTSQRASTFWTYFFFGLSGLTVFTFGFVNVGAAYVTRGIVMGDPVFPYSDFFYAIKRNWRQGLIVGVIDSLILALLGFDLYYLFTTAHRGFDFFLLWTTVAITIIYIFMRYYLYLQMVTFDLSIRKLLKNSLIFAILGMKRNFLALLGTIIFVVINILCLFGLGGYLLFLGIAIPMMFLFAHVRFMGTYAAYYKMKEIMIDPLQRQEESDEGSDPPVTEEV
ncbi:MAG: DUF624 domain-containing protein [Clostridia bacterium]|nr:DUF624 domain-containing protein [Clostridia bacterium]